MHVKRLSLAGMTVLSLMVAAQAVAQTRRADLDEAKTLKEKLSDKASDGQRVDDCRVPVDRRGPVLRPGCATARSDRAAGAE